MVGLADRMAIMYESEKAPLLVDGKPTVHDAKGNIEVRPLRYCESYLHAVSVSTDSLNRRS